jgi:hypothetical protein
MTFDCSLSNSSYEMHNVPARVLHQVDEALYPYDPNWKRVGVNVSGGADSAVGTSILASLIEELGTETEIYFLTNVRVWNNRPWAGPISVEVYEKIKSMFPGVTMHRIQNFIPPELEEGSIGMIEQINNTGDRMCTQSFNSFAVYTYKLDAVYNFITNNPDPETVEHSRGPWDRIWTAEKLAETSVCPQYVTHSKDSRKATLVHPWKLIKKDFILGQYYRRGWEELLNTTRSCEGDKNLFPDGPFEDYTTYEHGTSELHECHEVSDTKEEWCYWCAEREWAKAEAKKKLETK